jgi:DNA helicase-2/ATP-dependent DNA helicase PcrA
MPGAIKSAVSPSAGDFRVSSGLLDLLNPAQREAVEYPDGPLLVLAGPGSGKTRVVTHRIARLIQRGASPSEILALTFTNKAAEEMQRRVETLVPGSHVWVSTFHRFGARLLRQHAELVGLTPNYTIYDASDARQTIGRVIEAAGIATGHFTPARIASAISSAKNQLITADQYGPRIGSPISQVVAEVYPLYQQRLLASSAVDFDDLLLHVAVMLQENPELRADLDQRYRYVLVDEYQDTNRAQYVMLRALAANYPNVTATGDPDQSIYGWRGADITNILQFEADFRDAKVIRLEQNYRSTPHILRVADALIEHNLRRKKKRLFTDRTDGVPVRLVHYADHEAEAHAIAADIAQQMAEGRPASDFAVFFRINALSRTLEQEFRRARIPYHLVRGVEFYQRKEIKDILGYCQLINNPRDDAALLRIINSPSRKIGRKTISRLNEHAYCHGMPLLEAARDAAQVDGLPARSAKAVRDFVALFDSLSTRVDRPVEEIVGAVLDETRYRDQYLDAETEEDANRLANIDELLTDARRFDEDYPEGGSLELYLENAWLVNETDGWEAESEKVTMMTLHAAKGLEFPVVYLVAVEQGILPHERCLQDDAQFEEERRLLFVGITRAMDRLQLSLTEHRDFRGQRRRTIPSPFLLEIPRDQVDFTICPGRPLADDACQFDATDEEIPWEMDPSWQPEVPTRRIHREDDDLTSFDQPDDAERNAPLDTDSTTDPSPATPLPNVTTAAKLHDDAGASSPRRQAPSISPDAFVHGMTVVHPVHGPGKITALSGSGERRRATVRFATAGVRHYVLHHSELRPV